MTKLLLILSLGAAAQTVLDAPTLARIVDGNRLVTLSGVSGNFIRDETGETLLAFFDDGQTEWRLEPGRLIALRSGTAASFSTTATNAIFRGEYARLPESGELLRFDGKQILEVNAADADWSPGHLAGRTLEWSEGQLRVAQADGRVDTVACPDEPESMTAAAADWAHLRFSNRSELLRLTAGRVALFRIPESRR